MRRSRATRFVPFAVGALGRAEAWLVVKDFDTLSSGPAPTWPWWHPCDSTIRYVSPKHADYLWRLEC